MEKLRARQKVLKIEVKEEDKEKNNAENEDGEKEGDSESKNKNDNKEEEKKKGNSVLDEVNDRILNCDLVNLVVEVIFLFFILFEYYPSYMYVS